MAKQPEASARVVCCFQGLFGAIFCFFLHQGAGFFLIMANWRILCKSAAPATLKRATILPDPDRRFRGFFLSALLTTIFFYHFTTLLRRVPTAVQPTRRALSFSSFSYSIFLSSVYLFRYLKLLNELIFPRFFLLLYCWFVIVGRRVDFYHRWTCLGNAELPAG